MVIDHRYQFIFVELPLLLPLPFQKRSESSTAVNLLNKHATYDDFLRKATSEERNTPASVLCNLLDQTVSMYFKYKNDLDERFSTGRKRPGKWLRKSLARNRDKVRYQYIIDNQASFEKYFLHFFRWPYSNWSIIHHKKFDHVIRFEHLVEDYRKYSLPGLPITRDLPQANKPGKES